MLNKPSKLKHILVLPRWYPNKTDIQLGIFIQRQLVLMQGDFNFTVVYAQPISNLPSAYAIESSQIGTTINEHIVYFKNSRGPLKKVINFLRYRKAQQLGIQKATQPVDLCHIHVPYRSALPALKLNRKKDIPFLITEHWSGHLNGKYQEKNSLDKFIYKRTLKRANKISTVSQSLCTAFLKNTGFQSQVIPNYIERSPTKLNQEEDKYIQVLSVGDFDDETKNITGLLTSFKMAFEENPLLKLTIIGGGPDEGLINKHIENLNLPKDAIKLKGRQQHEFVLTAMHTCDFYICNSRYETFGMTVAEALICGKPVISTICGGPEEFLSAKNSLRIEPAKIMEVQPPEILSAAITKMATTYKSYNSQEISTAIENEFGKASVRKKWLDFYN